MKDKVFRLKGKVQHYAWGGYDFLPSLLGIDNTAHQPFAEYWLGVHPAAPSQLIANKQEQSWQTAIIENPEAHIGKNVYYKFGELPYLFKVLDVRDMLSIQVHPTKQAAEYGYHEENEKGTPLTAHDRNYKDKNHKPEVMVALSDFWLLHGFKKEDELQKVLASIPEFAPLRQIFAQGDYYSLYKYVMEMSTQEAYNMLLPLVTRELSGNSSKDEPGYWVKKLYNREVPQNEIDRGVFSIYFFNLVKLKEGEGIFQAAGVPHAYLEGQNIELMANSDNVLRGGLTPKYIDVPELLKHIIFEGINPDILYPEKTEAGVINYSVPVEDFGINKIELESGKNYSFHSHSAEVIIVMNGEVDIEGLLCKKGDAVVILANADYKITAHSDTSFFKAFVPEAIT